MAKKTKRGLQSVGQILADYDLDKKKYITREFQDYGYSFAGKLNDFKRKRHYI